MLDVLCKSVIIANVVMFALATTAVALRIYVRKWKRLPLMADDYMIIFALMVTIGLFAEGLYAGATDLFAMIAVSADYSAKADKIYWIDVLLMHFIYGITKLSVLQFYKRIFMTKKFVLVVNITIAAVSGWMIAGFVAQIFSTTPINSMWQKNFNLVWNYDYGSFLFAMAMLDIVFDLFIMGLPMPVIRKLNMSTRKKLSLVSIFALGLFCIVASAIRTYYTWKLSVSLTHGIQDDQLRRLASWSDIWSHIEAGASVVTACLPTLAPLFPFIVYPRRYRSRTSSRSSRRRPRHSDMPSQRRVHRQPTTPTTTTTVTHSRDPQAQRLPSSSPTSLAAEEERNNERNWDRRIVVQKSWARHVEEDPGLTVSATTTTTASGGGDRGNFI